MSDMILLERKLHALRSTAAPRDLASNVLLRVGIADQFASMETALGAMYVAWNAAGVSLVRPAKTARAFSAKFEAECGRQAFAAEMPGDLRRTLERRLLGDRVKVPVDLRSLSAFERNVLESTAGIPRGAMRPYAWIAAQIGSPRAMRAVGSALGKNPVPLLIPCHRVIRNDGAIGNYIFGAAKKARLLTMEGAI